MNDYELEREKRIADNKRRMEEMGLLQVRAPASGNGHAGLVHVNVAGPHPPGADCGSCLCERFRSRCAAPAPQAR